MHPFLSAPGECAALIRDLDWAATPLGPIEGWSQCLRSMVGMMLHSRQPMFLFWGPEHICLYNDAYRPSFGKGKHPEAMGRPAPQVFEEAWDLVIGPQIDSVMQRAEPTWHDDQLVPVLRNGRMEEAYWTYGYSPAFGATEVEGAVVVCTETTDGVLSLRRLQSLHQLASAIAAATDAPAISRAAADILVEVIPAAIPFVQVFDASGAQVYSAGLSGALAEQVAEVVCEAVEASGGGEVPLPETVQVFGSVWPERVPAVYVTRVAQSFGNHAYFAFGTNPRLPFDDAYRRYLEQIGEHIAAANSRVEAFQVRAVVEAERNELLEQAPVAAAIFVGPELVFRLTNARYQEMLGRNDLVGKPYLEAFPEVAGTPISQMLEEAYQTGKSFTQQEMHIALADDAGELVDRYFNFVLQPIRDAEGEVFALMAIAVDITVQVEARKVLEVAATERSQLVENLEEASRAKDEFLAMLGHELRNPLAPILTALDVLRLRKVQGIEREAGIIERSARHMVGLVDDLLDVSRITRGLLELDIAQVSLAQVAARAIELASPLIDQRRHQLTVDIPDDLQLGADPARLAQVLANLLSNSAKYTDIGGHIELRAASHGDVVVIEVVDDGFGLDSDRRDDLFQAFVRGDREVSVAGLGLGLAIVKSLVTAHGGEVSLYSEGPGCGTTCTVRLPRWAASAEGAGSDEAAPTRSAAGRTIVLVDDNRDAADLLAMALRVLGHTVHLAYDPLQALELATSVRPDVALLDLGLPVMDGHELCQRLVEVPGWSEVRFVAVTGYGQRSDKERSLAAGFHHHLVKPVDLEQVAEILRLPSRT